MKRKEESDNKRNIMKDLRQGKKKLNYHTEEDLPTKDEVIKNFR